MSEESEEKVTHRAMSRDTAGGAAPRVRAAKSSKFGKGRL